jgi:hypothetical protein
VKKEKNEDNKKPIHIYGSCLICNFKVICEQTMVVTGRPGTLISKT